jgi:hypothetical protein
MFVCLVGNKEEGTVLNRGKPCVLTRHVVITEAQWGPVEKKHPLLRSGVCSPYGEHHTQLRTDRFKSRRAVDSHGLAKRRLGTRHRQRKGSRRVRHGGAPQRSTALMAHIEFLAKLRCIECDDVSCHNTVPSP